MLKWEAVPQSGMPYVHIGFSIVLYSRNLFAKDSSDLRVQDPTHALKQDPQVFTFGEDVCCPG